MSSAPPENYPKEKDKPQNEIPTTFGYIKWNSQAFRESMQKKKVIVHKNAPREIARGRYTGHKFFKLKG